MLKSLLLNPLLIACVIGLALWGADADIPPLLLTLVDLFSRPAITLGLLAAGAGLSFAHLFSAFNATLLWSAFRLVVFPALALHFCLTFGLGKFETMIAVICCATPTAVNGYILAKELGGDHVFSASLIAMQTVLSLATLPLFITLTAMFAPA